MKFCPSYSSLLCFFFLVYCTNSSCAQQEYIDNKQLDCYKTNDSTTLGYSYINGSQTSCCSYLTFRPQSPYNSTQQIASLLNSDSSDIIVTDDIVIVPTTCSNSGDYYQHNASYTIIHSDGSETYFVIANDTYQGLSTCQAMMAQNPYDPAHLPPWKTVVVPLRCACPTEMQLSEGINYLLTYLVTWGDDVPIIAKRFGVQAQLVYEANKLSSTDIIYPFTTILVPLETNPTLMAKTAFI